MSDDIREALLQIMRETFPSDLQCADDILDRFLVVPREDITTEYGWRRTPGGVVFPQEKRREAVNGARSARRNGHEAAERVERTVLPWAVIPLPEAGSDG